LGAATTEAQENVALQVAEQMSDYLLQGAIQNAVNFPSITAEEAPRLKPFVTLAEKHGSFLGQLTEAPIRGIRIEYEGAVAGMNTRALTSAAVTGVLRPFLQDINMVSAPVVARDRGIMVEEVRRENAARDYESFVRIVVEPRTWRATRRHGVPGRQAARHRNRDIAVDAEFAPHMIYVRNADQPGFIGAFGSLWARRGQHRHLQSRPRSPGRRRRSASWPSTSRIAGARLADRGDPAGEARAGRAVLRQGTRCHPRRASGAERGKGPRTV
jgi:D-3-phosphoglycerate dehydrogenase